LRDLFIPKTLEVDIDSRENYPLLFPSSISLRDPFTAEEFISKVETRKIRLDAGDYRLSCYPDLCIVERKGTFKELAANFLSEDRHRQGRAFKRLSSACKYPVLLVEEGPHQLYKKSLYIKNPDFLSQRLFTVCGAMGFNLIFIPPSPTSRHRREVGRMLLHLFVSYAIINYNEQNAKQTG